MATNTPWGPADSAEKLARGIVWYSTPGHGGVHLSKGRVEMLPAYLKGESSMERKGWFEEDVAWSKVALAFPKAFTARQLAHAEQLVQNYYPSVWAGHEAYLRDRAVWQELDAAVAAALDAKHAAQEARV